MRLILIPILAVLCYGRSPSKSDLLDLNQAIKLASNVACDGTTNPQQEIILNSHFSPNAQQRFIVNKFQDETCRADLGVKCLKHEPAGWRDDLTIGADGTNHYWLSSCLAHGSKEAAQYSLSGWYKQGSAKKKGKWMQAALKQVSAQPEIYEFTGPEGSTARVEIKRR